MQFTPRSTWTLPRLQDLPSWADAGRVCVDIETKDPQLKKLGPGVRRDGYITGIGFAIEGGPAAYLPMRHGNGTNLDPKLVIAYFQDQAKVFKGEIVGANLQYDLDYLAEQNILFRPKFFRDIQIAEPLLDENQLSFSLDNIAGRRNIPGKNEEHLREAAKAWGVDPKKGMWELPPEHVGIYVEQDLWLPLQILRHQEQEIAAQDLQRIWDLESRLLPVLLKMRRAGVRVDFDRLDRIEKWSIQEETSALAQIAHLTGFRLAISDTTKAASIVPVLRHIGLNIPRTAPTAKFPQGQDSIKSDWLKTLPKNDVIVAVLRARKFNKLRGTFVKSIRTHAVGDRIHCTFKQIVSADDEGGGGDDEESGARYGRMSCKDPNLQQQPARDKEIGPEWRAIYIPDEGGRWLSADYSQQEPRWTTHFAEVSGCRGASEAAQRYRDDPNTDNHQMMADIAGIERKPAKEIFLGLTYGMGSGKLARKLDFGTKWIFSTRQNRDIEVGDDECQALLDLFHSKVPYLKELSTRCQARATQRGYILTVGGRRCRFPLKRNGRGYDLVHKALNRLIQGSSGDQTKQATVDADAAGVYLQLQVHDELDGTIYDPKEGLLLREIMENCVPCNVPSKVDLEEGPSWGEATKPEWA
jgi:DNA polymerase I-like protein with 3'-5' exonuclease and polymerase domains